jgi:hypothetical protein
LQAHLKAAPANPKTKAFKRACKGHPKEKEIFKNAQTHDKKIK